MPSAGIKTTSKKDKYGQQRNTTGKDVLSFITEQDRSAKAQINSERRTQMKRKSATRGHNSERVSRWLYLIALCSFVATLIYLPLRATLDSEYAENSDYKLILLQSVLGIIVLNLPSILTKRLMWRIPHPFTALYTLFLWGSIFLGEAMSFYYRFPHWDTLLHLTSSMMLGMLGFSMIEILNRDRRHALVSLSPFFVALFSVCFALTVGVLWEIYEFTFDGLLDLNMQKFAAEDGQALLPLVGREALADTMEDLIIDLTGAVAVAILGYISIKHGKGWLNSFRVEIGSPEEGEIPTPVSHNCEQTSISPQEGEGSTDTTEQSDGATDAPKPGEGSTDTTEKSDPNKRGDGSTDTTEKSDGVAYTPETY